MSKVKLELKDTFYKGMRQILKGPEMEAYISEEGAKRAQAAGDGYESRVHDSGQRQIANVYAVSEDAVKDNAENDTLLKVLGM